MTTDMLPLRDYQRAALDAVARAELQRPAVVLPTGSGKTVIFSHMAAEHVAEHGTRVMILVHRDELADQTLAKLHAVAPHLDLGKVKAGDNQITADVMVCSVQTLARENRINQVLAAVEQAGHIGLVIVDECHHAVAVSYRNIMAVLGCYSGDRTRVRSVGFTATMARGDGVGLGSVWEEVVFTKSTLWMIKHGYLSDVKAQTVDMAELNLNSVKTTAGDYQAKDLGNALMEAGAPDMIAQVLHEHASGRRPIVFTPTVEMAHATADALTRSGIPAGIVSGKTPREERLLTYKRYRTGELRALVNCMVLTEGADFPWADCAVIARPTRSPGLFIQMVGRVLRPYPGKTEAQVLILAGEGGKICTLIDLDPGLPEVKDGELLTDARQREDDRLESIVPAREKRFELKVKATEIFGQSMHYDWLRTDAGVQFIPAPGTGYVALWPSAEPELWDVALVPERAGRFVRLHEGLSLGVAMGWAESESDEYAAIDGARTAGWRRKKASVKMLAFAHRITGRTYEPDTRAGELSNIIAQALASRRIDLYVRKD